MSIDIGGSGLKAMLLDAGASRSASASGFYPAVPTPDAVLDGLDELRVLLRISIAFRSVFPEWSSTAYSGSRNLHPYLGKRIPLPANWKSAGGNPSA